MNERRIGISMPIIVREPDNGLGGGNNVTNSSGQRVEAYTQANDQDPLAGMNSLQRQLALKLGEFGIKPENVRHTHKLNPEHTRVGL